MAIYRASKNLQRETIPNKFVHMHVLLIKTDTNECLRNPCSQLCTNTEGSYKCDCMGGFQLQENGRNCEGNKYVTIFLNGINIII